MDNLPTQYQEFIYKSRYAKWIEGENRRENWNETVERYFDFFEDHLKENFGYKLPKSLRSELQEAVLNLEIMPSMRALMTAGEALKRDNIAGYNCSYVAINNIRALDEILYILMCGTGVGFSVERQYVEKLPTIAEQFTDSETLIVVQDSKIGWAKAYRELVSLLVGGQIPKWDLSKIRPAGARLKTFGGRASGPRPLEDLFFFTADTFRRAAGRKLTSIECHDIVCKIAEIVVVGGVRRSALISLSNLTDERMREAKVGSWWEQNPQRALANNSVAYKEKPEIGTFMEEWVSLYKSKSGERGIFNRDACKKAVAKLGDRRDPNHEWGSNPCSEIILRDKEFCNLTEVIVRPEDTFESLKRKIRLATILGTWQASLTHFPYLSSTWKRNCEEEALLGVSLTGIMDNKMMRNALPNLESTLPQILTALKQQAIETNAEWAKTIGINPAAAITCVKPSGCGTLDTKIKTTHGDMSFSEIFEVCGVDPESLTDGQWVKPPVDIFVYDENNDERIVTSLYVKGMSPVFEIEDENGNIYKFSSEHKLLTQSGWKTMRELTTNDQILSFDPLENLKTLYNYSVSNQGEVNEQEKNTKTLC
jgi:ribonucleoside-diphosphate reductase alpha chain